MSKLITDSETLIALLEPGVIKDDNALFYKVKKLKDTVSACSLRRAELRLNGEDEETQETLDRAVDTLVDVYQFFKQLHDDFEDIINPKKGGSK